MAAASAVEATILNPATGRMVKIDGAIGKRILRERAATAAAPAIEAKPAVEKIEKKKVVKAAKKKEESGAVKMIYGLPSDKVKHALRKVYESVAKTCPEHDRPPPPKAIYHIPSKDGNGGPSGNFECDFKSSMSDYLSFGLAMDEKGEDVVCTWGPVIQFEGLAPSYDDCDDDDDEW